MLSHSRRTPHLTMRMFLHRTLTVSQRAYQLAGGEEITCVSTFSMNPSRMVKLHAHPPTSKEDLTYFKIVSRRLQITRTLSRSIEGLLQIPPITFRAGAESLSFRGICFLSYRATLAEHCNLSGPTIGALYTPLGFLTTHREQYSYSGPLLRLLSRNLETRVA